MLVYATPAAARAEFADTRGEDGPRSLAGPAVRADQVRYAQRGRFPSLTTTLRWRVGPFLGRISGTTATGFGATTLAQLFTPVRARLAQLVTGKLRAPALTITEKALLPPRSVAPGKMLGVAHVPVESWR